MTRPGYRMRVRARGHAVRDLTGRQGWDAHIEQEPNEDGWSVLSVSVETRWTAIGRVLQFGADIELLEPDDLREQVAGIIGRMSSIY